MRAGAVRLDSGEATAWDPGLSEYVTPTQESSVLDLVVTGNTVYLAGEFVREGEPGLRDLIAVDAISGDLKSWDANATGGVNCLGVAGRDVLAGFVASPGGLERRNLAAFDLVTGQATEWDPATDGEVSPDDDETAEVESLVLDETT